MRAEIDGEARRYKSAAESLGPCGPWAAATDRIRGDVRAGALQQSGAAGSATKRSGGRGGEAQRQYAETVTGEAERADEARR